MPRRLLSSLLVALCALALTAPAFGQGYLNAFSNDFDRVSGRLADLAEAVPADQFGWSPEGVRTISQVYIHVAAANFNLAGALGVETPEGFGRDAEQTITEKDDVIETLKQSQNHVRQAVQMAMEAEDEAAYLNDTVQAFGQDMPRYQVFFILQGHNHEHLGQSIAYARMNGVTPPWSQ